MKQLKFEHVYAEKIKKGEKTATFRVNDDKDIIAGDRVELVDKVDNTSPSSWLLTGVLLIKEVEIKAITQLGTEYFNSGGDFKDSLEMIATFRRFYGEHVDENTQVTILKFEFIPYETPRKFLEQNSTNERFREVSKLFADGGSRGNPGPSASGFVVTDANGQVIFSDNKYLGVTTNNQAEYHALIMGLEWCIKNQVQELDVQLDSMLVVSQMKGIFRVKNRDLWSLYELAKKLSSQIKSISYTHIPRELNKLADREVNKALDAVKGADAIQ